MCSDGVGGLWMICLTKSNGKGGQGEKGAQGHRLWHVNTERELELYDTHPDVQMATDGNGGVWTICRTRMPPSPSPSSRKFGGVGGGGGGSFF